MLVVLLVCMMQEPPYKKTSSPVWLSRDKEQVVRFENELPVPKVGEPTSLHVELKSGSFFLTPVDIHGKRYAFLIQSGAMIVKMFADSVPERPQVTLRESSRIPPFRNGALVEWNRRAEEPSSTDIHGLAGLTWLVGRTWTFDFVAPTVLWRSSGDLPEHVNADRVGLGFETTGADRLAFPQIDIRVEGEAHSMLLDVGAIVALSPEGRRLLGNCNEQECGISFIAESVFDGWRSAHPTWRVADRADAVLHEPMIEVPTVEIVGKETGPVWFMRRADNVFKEKSRFMQRPIVGTIGGNALRTFVVTLDFSSGTGVFQRP